jgi:hypothetical protein
VNLEPLEEEEAGLLYNTSRKWNFWVWREWNFLFSVGSGGGGVTNRATMVA